MITDVLAGLLGAFAILALGKATRQANTIPFYSTVLIVIALVYVLFAVMAGQTTTIVAESAIAAVFVVIAVFVARSSRPHEAGLVLAAGLVVHGAYDLVHGVLIANVVVPNWWPVFCGVVDVVLGGWVGSRAVTDQLQTRFASA